MRKPLAGGMIGGGLALLALASPAWAIPSPELIVGSFASLSQLFALAAAVLGGGGALAAARAGQGGARASRALLIATAVLFVLLAGSVGANIWQYTSHANETQARLEDTLLRPARIPGSLPLDPENQEWSYRQQMENPLGVPSAQVARLLDETARGARSDTVFIDVRERPERAAGTIPGLTYLRYQDITPAALKAAGAKKAILFCHNGNRSGETCAELKKQGIDCGFLQGGFEKWVVEGRPLDGKARTRLEDLRGIPDHRNGKTLLDTPEVRRLVAEERALFVDVRYPREFETHGRLPDAVNLPIRRLSTPELERAIAALPKRPLILACYDRRGCFASEVLGWELTQAGHDYRGRYTQPWAYFVPGKRLPHVEDWIAESNRSLFEKGGRALAGGMEQAVPWTGAVGIIVLLALLSRLLVLPFSVKSERDQMTARRTAAEFEALKARLKHDPVRRTRAIRAFYRRHGMTPGFNLVALLFLPVMAVALLAVQTLADRVGGSFLWIPELNAADPLFILPVLFAALITLYVDLAFGTSTRKRIAIWLLLGPVMVATGLLFSAAGDLYLVTSAALLVLQRLWVDGRLAALRAAWARRGLPEGAIPLADAQRLDGLGNKAHRLAQLRAAGLPVPDGLLLTGARVEALAAMAPEAREPALDAIWKHLGGVPLAVRSSAAFEDGADHSFAGVFESVLHVDRAGLAAAIETVRASYAAAHVGAYTANGGTGSVLVQRMVQAQYAGVMFTRDPVAGALTMVEMVAGTAQDLVSGTVRPQTFRFGRASKAQFGKGTPPIDLAPLLALGDAAERLFGAPQDVEWTYAEGRFLLVQSRDITRTADDAAQADLARAVDAARGAAADAVVYAKTELSEMLPRPTPLSLSLMRALYAPGGSVEMAARRLKLSYPAAEGEDYLVTILGRLYVDKRVETARALDLSWAARRRLLRAADALERELREAFLPDFLAQIRAASVADFDKLTAAELVDEIRRMADRFLTDTHVTVDTVNIAAFVTLDHARRLIEKKGADASALLGHIPETIEGKALAEIAAKPDKTSRWLAMQTFGHRAALDYELAEPRFGEDVAVLDRVVAGRAPGRTAEPADAPAIGARAQRALDLARRFQTLKEDAKHHSLRELALIRKALLALDRRLALGGLVFHLTLDEVTGLDLDRVGAMQKVAASRRETAERLRKAKALPAQLTARDIEAAAAGDGAESHGGDAVIRGTRVAGSAPAEGRAYVVSEEAAEHGDAMEGFRDGDIVVTAMINPAWLPYFSRAGGFVSEVGGWLSHPAILAREYDVPMLVGVEGLGRIAHGTRLRLGLDGRIEVLDEDAKAAAA